MNAPRSIVQAALLGAYFVIYFIFSVVRKEYPAHDLILKFSII